MKRKSLLVLFLSVLVLASCANNPPIILPVDNSLKCPAGEKGDYQTVDSSSTEYNDITSGSAFYGRGIWSGRPTLKTEGTWLFKTGDSPVNVKYSSKCADKVSSSVQIRSSSPNGTSSGWQTISNASEGFSIPANYTCRIKYTSSYWSTSRDICFEFYLYCSNE